ncbi:MAG: hypothetical protein RIC14_04475 [Filomicrobium sp.]
MSITVGLDVGGAHLKVARFEGDELVAVRQFASPLWKGFDRLGQALGAAMPLLTGAERVAITMTGELSDLFENRRRGVFVLTESLEKGFGPKAQFYLGPRGFGSAADAREDPQAVSSMNYLATAQVIGRQCRDGLLVDFGSTTVDIIPVCGGETPTPCGDFERQASGALVYTGLTRTAVASVTTTAPFKGKWVGLSREFLATMADVRRVLGEDLEDIDVHATADGRGKSQEESTARLARMFGCDLEDGTQHDWIAAASYIREAQLRSVSDGTHIVLSERPLPNEAALIAAGIGAHEAEEIARRLGRPFMTFGELLSLNGSLARAATHHAAAVAVGHLLIA